VIWLLAGAVLVPIVAPARAADPRDLAGAPAAVRRALFRAETARQQGDLETAQRLLAEALAGSPATDHPALRHRLGAYLLELNRSGEALAHLRRAGALAPGEDEVWRDLGRAAYETGAYAEAAIAFTRAYRIARARRQDTDRVAGTPRGAAGHPAPDPRLLYFGGAAWLQADRPDSALAILETLATVAPDTVAQEWVAALVSAAAAADQPRRADTGVARLLRDHSQRPSVWRLASQQAQLAGDLSLAAVRLQVSDWLAPLPPFELPHLAELHAAAGAPRRAARAYARAMAASRRDHSLADQSAENMVERLAVTWLQAHEPDSARVVLREELTYRPNHRLFLLLGDLEYGIQRWGQAASAYAQAAELAPGEGRAWLMLGACEVRRQRPAMAAEHLKRAMTDSTTAARARSLLRQVAVSSRTK
jgi:tetratricopeptide (TPR) repeat protein